MKLKHLLMLVLMFVAGAVQAQQEMLIPADKDTRVGKLENGLTYYIRHNEYPEHVANFYIAQRVGSIQENDDQRGLAHFLEHMAFNGSDHFKENGIIEFTRSLGVQFGSDLNAYTSIERTVYNIDNVPTARQSALDSCLLVLRDWSNGLELNPAEIDKERGVIHGEWSMRNSATQRLIERNLPTLYPGNKYGERLPIGLMEIIDTFTPGTLRQYYETWYHPENQAIIVVGDIDVDHTEAKIKELFADIKAGPHAQHVVKVPVADNNEAIYVYDKDKEMQQTSVDIMLKSDPMPDELRGTIIEWQEEYIRSMVVGLFNSRVQEMVQQPDCPFNSLGMNAGNYLLSSTKDVVEFSGSPKEGRELEALEYLVREARRAKEFGFNASEFIRVKEEYLSSEEKSYSNRNKRKNNYYYNQCLSNFIDNSAMPDADTEHQISLLLAENIGLDIINQYAKAAITIDNDTNFVLLMLAQEKEGKTYPTIDELKAAVAKGRAAEVTAWVDDTPTEPLIAKMPKAGKIKKEGENTALGFKEFTLSNGARIVYKKTDFKDDEISLNGFAKGGDAQYGESDYVNLKVFNRVINASGLGNFTNNELGKALAGKQASVSIGLDSRYNEISGGSTPKDLETMMQLIYLHFTALKKDEKTFQTMMNSMEAALKTRDLSPEIAFSDTVTKIIYCGNPRNSSVVLEDLQKINHDRIMQIARENFSNVNNYTFVFVGNIDEQQLRTLACQYIGALPGKGKVVKTSDIRTFFTGDKIKTFTRKMETPKPTVLDFYLTEGEYTQKNSVICNYISQILSMMLLKTVREEASATYNISAYSGISNGMAGTKEPDYALLQVQSPISEVAKVDTALVLIDEGIKELCKTCDNDMLTKVKANFVKQAGVNAKTNGYWQGIIETYLVRGIDNHNGYIELVESITPEMISTYLRENIMKKPNHMRVVMLPE